MVRKTSAKIAMIAKAPMSARVSRRAKRTKMTKEKNWSDMKRTIDQPTECLLCRRKFVSNRAPSAEADRKSVVKGKRVSVRVDLGGSRIIKQKTNKADGTISDVHICTVTSTTIISE